jgi:hypothetical protein
MSTRTTLNEDAEDENSVREIRRQTAMDPEHLFTTEKQESNVKPTKALQKYARNNPKRG